MDNGKSSCIVKSKLHLFNKSFDQSGLSLLCYCLNKVYLFAKEIVIPTYKIQTRYKGGKNLILGLLLHFLTTGLPDY